SRAGHPGWRRCSSLKYSRYFRSSRLAIRAPRSAIWSSFSVDGPLERRGGSESRRQIELEHPALARTIERPRKIELADGIAEQVCAQCDACAADAVAGAAEKRRLLAAVPGNAAVREQRQFDRHRTIHVLRDAERSQQREPEFQ